ncbi:related to Zn-dependent oxidoreductases [Phialocephala subalpina]|uniref:Related to Zn-dependent oxidoreductases n=1 Tax=Phialocephala subalpina TaxID=576137 RepID=A0A1L7XBS1_9HELO|nr:related to Zn-dependent oxidoreductases [Phialocephala subalpina]
MSTHAAVVSVAIRAPLDVIQIPTVKPGDGEVLVKVQWTASTPLDLHQNDGSLLVNHPQVLGSGIAGIVVELGLQVKNLKVGDQVFGFGWREQKEKAHQELATVPEYLLGKIPANSTPQEAVTLPNNFVTVFHAVTTDLELPLPWPRPSSAPEHANDPILIWGGSSSVGQYALQILRYYGYTNLLATASKTHHEALKAYGAREVFDYRDPEISSKLLEAAGGEIPFVLDCIGSKNGSIIPISKFAKKRAKVAVLLPVIIKDASETEAPEYGMSVEDSANWAEGVVSRGVRTHFYLKNGLFKDKLQSEIMPTLLAEGIVRPNKYRIIEGKTLKERAQGAIDALRRKEVSGERLVWRISE